MKRTLDETVAEMLLSAEAIAVGNDRLKRNGKFTVKIDEDSTREIDYPWPKQWCGYIALMYHPLSPVKAQILEDRRRECSRLQGISDYATDLLYYNELLGDLVTRFFRLLADFEIEILWSANEFISNTLKAVRQPIIFTKDDKQTQDTLKAQAQNLDLVMNMVSKVRQIEKSLFMGDTDMMKVTMDKAGKTESAVKPGAMEIMVAKAMGRLGKNKRNAKGFGVEEPVEEDD